MTGYKIVNLQTMVEVVGENTVKGILSDFSCPLNPDVESFLKKSAIEFSKHGWAQTHLVFASYREKPVLVGYFSLANKHIRISLNKWSTKSSTLRKRLSAFASYDKDLRAYFLSAPLIAQLGKNYAHGYNKLISGDALLDEACEKISKVQSDLGGRFAYVECEDKECLTTFYEKNGFCYFDQRTLDADETETLSGEYLVQLLKYIHKKN